MKLCVLTLACLSAAILYVQGAALEDSTAKAGCSNVQCQMHCDHGFLQDEKGCPKCECAPSQAVDCPAVECVVHCEHGYKKSKDNCPTCICLEQAKAQSEKGHGKGHSWGYHGDQGPAHWGGACKDGERQSPINIVTQSVQYNADLEDFNTWHQLEDLPDVSMYIANDGHKISIGVEGGDIIVDGGSLGSAFKVAGAHFHWGESDDQGSEHTVDGKAFPLEMHIVTFDNERFDTVGEALKGKDSLAVLGVLFQIQEKNNTLLEEVVDNFDKIMSPNGSNKVNVPKVPLNKLLPSVTARFYRYLGSLTTPGCFENVIWTVFEEPVGISKYQMAKFRSLMREAGEEGGKPLVNNYRPVQALNSRSVFSSFAAPAPPPKNNNGGGYDVKVDKSNSATKSVLTISSLFALISAVILTL